ncbi:MAG: FHA domain-containing protein [Planctomycetes bacterium]|nr:FHA domain-containing protein [Planctomycetota bacterium]
MPDPAATDRLRVILEEGGQSRPFEFDAEQITIGRTADNAVRISDALSSRHHCQIKRGPAGWVVTDLKSRNGTKLNGEPLTADHVLRPGDRIEVGESIVHFAEKRGARQPSVKTKRREKPAEAPAAAAPDGPPLTAADRPALVVAGQRVALASFPFVIGRKKSCGLPLDDGDVSNEHCMVVEDEGALHLVDLGSTNGTLVDGERLRGRTPLRRGAVLRLGSTLEVRVEAEGAAPARPASKKAPGVPRSDRHDKPKAPPKSDRNDRSPAPAPAPAAVDEVDDLDALDADADDDVGAQPAAPRGAKRPVGAQPAAPRGAKRAQAAPKPGDAADAAEVVAGEGDVAPADFTARLEAAASQGGGGGGGGGGAALVVVALVLVVGALGATAATTLVARPEGDPAPADGLVENWSFEEPRRGDGSVPGWELAADGAALVQEGVAHGKRALALQVAPGARPEFRSAAPLRVTAERAYRVRAAVSLDARVGAALRVDWSAEDDPSFARSSWAVVLDPGGQATGGWRDVGGTVVAPRGATLARVVGVALASADGPAGRARFDRVHLVASSEAPQPFVLDGPAGLSLRVDERGVTSVHRDRRELAAELALAVDLADPLAHQRAARVDQPTAPQPDESLLALGAIPDGGGGRVDYAFSAAPDAGGLRLRWSGGPRAAPLHLVFLLPRLEDVAPLELDGKDVTGQLPSAPVTVSEMAWGKNDRQVSFRFTAPAALTLRRVGSGAELSFAVPPRPIATGEAGVGVDVGAASSGTRDQLRRLLEEAEQAAAQGEHARALEAYRRLAARFSHDRAVVERANRAVEEISRRAQRLADVVEFARREAQELPLPPLAQAARAVIDELERGFDGTPQLDRARRELGLVDDAVAAARRAEQQARVRELLDRAQRLREAGHVHLARLIYQGIVDHVDEGVPGVADARTRLAALPPQGGAR